MMLKLQETRIWSWQLVWAGLGLVACMIVCGQYMMSRTVLAQHSAWLHQEPQLISRQMIPSYEKIGNLSRNFCEYQDIAYVGEEMWNTPVSMRMCVSEGDGFQLAQGIDARQWPVYAISIGYDSKFYRLNLGDVGGSAELTTLPGSKKLIVSWLSESESNWVYMYDNFLENITQENNRYYIKTKTGPSWHSERMVFGWGVSRNGRYIAYGGPTTISQYAWRDNVILEDIETGKRGIIGHSISMYLALPNDPAGYAISDDGTQVISTGVNSIKVWDIVNDCLGTVTNEPAYSEPCPSRNFHHSWFDRSNFFYLDGTFPKVNEDFSEISFVMRTFHYGTPEDNEMITIKNPSVGPQKLDYLAMGDSYSSGEGDVVDGKSSFYIKGTGPVGGCHQSSRSYPYLLRDYWNINQSMMDSIACSGARVLFDYAVRSGGYDGQRKLSGEKINGTAGIGKDEAAQRFIPGVVPQLEFVKKYKPSVITITGGGNDVGFADTLIYCASPGLEGLFVDDTCRYAKDDNAKQELINTIHGQYEVTKRLVSKIRQASPSTKVYIIGYPQFIAQPSVTCSYNAASLNTKERKMIREMVTEMNNVLWRAATDSGAIFVDIEDSLEGGQLCQGSKYVTGLHNLSATQIFYDDKQSLFHPNANGQLKMAKAIYNKVADPETASAIDERQALSAEDLKKIKVIKAG